MPGAFHKLGANRALQELGLAEPDHTVRNVAIAGAAGAPFLGLIGEKPVLHDPLVDPNVPRVQSLKELEKLTQPGDVLLTTKPGISKWKIPQMLGQGREWHHIVTPISGETGLSGLSKGLIRNWELYGGRDEWLASGRTPPEAELRQFSPQQYTDMRRKLPRLGEGLSKHYPDAFILRPKTPLSPGELKKFEEGMLRQGMEPYRARQAVRNWLRDIFVPKIEGVTGHTPWICAGNICSTMPARQMEAITERAVLPGKASEHMLPLDWARAPEYEAVAAHLTPGRKTISPRLLKALKYGTRGAMGLGLAGGVYGLAQLFGD